VAAVFADSEGFGVAVGVAAGFDPAPMVEAMDGLGLLAELVFDETGPRAVDRLAFRFAGEVEFRNMLDEFEALCLLATGFRPEAESEFDRGRVVSRPAFALEFPAGTVNTTSSPFERCST
jgi:hypothetical protein